MITVELLSFIKKELASGKNKEQIKMELSAGGGWNVSDIEEAFSSIESFVVNTVNNLDNYINQTKKKVRGFFIKIIILIVINILLLLLFFWNLSTFTSNGTFFGFDLEPLSFLALLPFAGFMYLIIIVFVISLVLVIWMAVKSFSIYKRLNRYDDKSNGSQIKKLKIKLVIVQVLGVIAVGCLIFGVMNSISARKGRKEEKLVHVQADLKRDGYAVVNNLKSLKQSFEFSKERFFIGYGSVPNAGSCFNPSEGSVFNVGDNFQPKEIVEKNTIVFQDQIQRFYVDMKKYTTDEKFFPFNHMSETQCFSNQDHFAYIVPSFYEKDFPKFYCIDDVYSNVQVRYGKIKGPSCDDLDPNYVPLTERLIPDKPYYVHNKVESLSEYENVVLEEKESGF